MTYDSSRLKSSPDAPSPGATVLRHWLVVLLAAGVGWRLFRYMRCFPFWGDEAYLNTSIMRLDYAELLGPLHYFQVAPLLYLWLQRTAYLLFGGGEFALRFSSLLAGLGALLLFWRLARRQLEPLATNVAVGFFACSYYLVRHTCESKPYAIDLLVATLLIWLAVRWWQTPSSTKWPLLATAVTVPAIWLSYPTVFVACGVSLVALVSSVRSKSKRGWVLWSIYSTLVVASFVTFLSLYALSASERAADSWLEEYWREAFPPRASVGAFLWWLVKIHCGRMFSYPHGGPHFASTLTTLLFLVGAVVLVIRRQGLLVLLFAGTAAATMFAAVLERYPYGGSVRVSIFFAPLICLIAGVGTTVVIDRIVPLRGRDAARGLVGFVLVGLAVFGIARDALVPYKSEEDGHMRDVMREVSQVFCAGDVVAIVNPEEGNPGPPDGPKFHQVLRYYLELYGPVEPTFRRGGPLPAEADWILAYHNQWIGPSRERVAQLASAAGLELTSEQLYPLSRRWPHTLTVYRCTTSVDLSRSTVSGSERD